MNDLVIELNLVSTIHKLQGSTRERVVLALNHRPGKLFKRLCIEELLVGVSRTKTASTLKILPKSDLKSLNYLKDLSCPPELLLWLKGLYVVDPEKNRIVKKWNPQLVSQFLKCDSSVDRFAKLLKNPKSVRTNQELIQLTKLVKLLVLAPNVNWQMSPQF